MVAKTARKVCFPTDCHDHDDYAKQIYLSSQLTFDKCLANVQEFYLTVLKTPLEVFYVFCLWWANPEAQLSPEDNWYFRQKENGRALAD